MKSQVKISFLFLVRFFASCRNTQEERQLSKQEALQMVDSAQLNSVIAAYKDSEGYSFIIQTNTSDKMALKIFCNRGFPDIIDTLVETQTDIFRSVRNRTLFNIQTNEVRVTYFQKIIHPSSNWQGQTPWQEINILKYPRIDKNFRP